MVSTIRFEIAKWWQTIKISWSNQMAYKLNFVLTMVGPALVFFFVKYNLWSAIYSLNPEMILQGYSFSDMIQYQIWVLIIGLIGQGHNSMQLAEDIRLGRISSYLIYPFNFWQFHAANFLAFQCLQFTIALSTLSLLWSLGLTTQPLQGSAVIAGVVFTLAVSCFWFLLQFLAGIVAFWLEETWILRVLIVVISQFLSGAIIPLEIYPSWLVNILHFTPFPYLTFVPAKIYMGEFNGSIPLALVILSGWFLVVFIVTRWVWSKGIRLYTAAGM